MCERDGCLLLSDQKTEAPTDECKCQRDNIVNEMPSEDHLFQTNLPIEFRTRPYHLQQQIHHMNMSYSPNNSPNASNHSNSSLCSNFTTDSSCSNNAPTPPCSPSIGVNLRVTGQCSQGGRKYMEDYFSVAYQQSENARDLEYAYIGIFDGHGGAEAAIFAKEHLMMEIINQKLFWSESDRDVLRAIREGYIATHYAMWRDQEKWPKTANGLPSTAGTTATVAFIRREKIYIGHVGDSGIVLGYQNENENYWRAKQLTTDHKPESVAESTRILRAGGKVVVKSGVPRVVWNRPRNALHKGPIRWNTPVDEIPFLAVARSLGDLWSYNGARNEFTVSPDPEVKVIQINPKTFRCLIFGTDGLWNVVTAKEAVDSVHEKESINGRLQALRGESPGEGSQWTNPSKGLVERALKTWSTKKMRADNTSVVTVILYPSGNISSGSLCAAQPPPGTCVFEPIPAYSPIPTYEDVTTYQELVEKYQPPEAYRNFNYYDDEESKALLKQMTSDEDLEAEPCMYWERGCDKMEGGNDAWDWDGKVPQNAEYSPAVEAINESAKIHEPGDEEDSGEEADDDDETVEHTESLKSVLNYSTYLNESTSSLDPGSGAPVVEDEVVGGYINSFAESFNSLLSEQMSQEASTSNSNPSYQSISGSSMHEILQEQQQYQQQCMSEEEGYSLTKLETRREQQRCSGVQTFKIFQQRQQAAIDAGYDGPQLPSTVDQSQFWEARYPAVSGALNKFFAYQQQQQQQKPLELNSLLQQEREEERQVALERMELERNMENATAASSYSSIALAPPESAEPDVAALLEEYLVDDLDLSHDETVQIHEISSSMTDSSHDVIEALLATSTPLITETIEKIEILHDKPELVIEVKPPPLYMSPTVSQTIFNKAPTKLAHSSGHAHFRNIPKENQQETALNRTAGGHYPLGSSSSLERRQLRSNGGASHSHCAMVDYSKRTLRTRNSLTKDLKAKASLTTTLKRAASVTNQLLRPSAVGYLGSSTAQQKQQQPTSCRINARSCSSDARSCSNRVNSCSRDGRRSNGSSKSKAEQLANLTKHVINLRSRQVYQLPTKSATATSSNSSLNGSVNAGPSLGSLCRERRSMRNLRRRSSPNKEAATNYSKSTTRMQSTMSTFAVPPPTPKLITAAAAMVAATRGRTLYKSPKLTAPPATTFSRRSALRSSSSGASSNGSSSVLVLEGAAANGCPVVKRRRMTRERSDKGGRPNV